MEEEWHGEEEKETKFNQALASDIHLRNP